MTIADFLAIRWGSIEGPLIEPPRFSPIIADPSFLFPEETPDGTWELFAHSAWGIHRYSSLDGLAWRDRGLAIRNAMRPFVRKIGEDYFLFYEAYPPIALALTALPVKVRWHSTIGLSRGADLWNWSPRKTILRPELAWTRDDARGESVSNPCLVAEPEPAGGGSPCSSSVLGPGSSTDLGSGLTGGPRWRLYYSASLVWIPDCGFCEPKHLALARRSAPDGPFTPENAPIADPAADRMPDSATFGLAPSAASELASRAGHSLLGAGSMKVIALDDGWVGLQNKIYRDAVGNSRSAIFILRSADGIAWRPARPEPLLAPAPGWTSSHVYACDCRYNRGDGSWYLYFNARDGWRIKDGVERIGRIVGHAAAACRQ
ncbi:MAG TPA: hypothetical protein VN445_13885 [Rectinemataceae bacterium]|nr:hypothetical protein [Rectinemataceae bacterium]